MAQYISPVGASANTPAAGYSTLYPKSDKTWAYKDDAGNEMVLYGGTVQTTIASVAGATADIFGARGNLIDYTGTNAATGFVAGATGQIKWLRASGAAQFTLSATFVCDGLTSGTISVSAGTVFQVVQEATLQRLVIKNYTGVGSIGEKIEATASAVTAPTSGQWGDITSISLPAGTWDVSANVLIALGAGGSITVCEGGIGTATGNSSAGVVAGDTRCDPAIPTALSSTSSSVPPKRYVLGSTTTLYLKMYAQWGTTAPTFYGRITAVRIAF